MSKYYKTVDRGDMTYDEALLAGKFITNNPYGGIMFINKNNKLTSILVNGDIVIVEDIKDKDKKIWNTVTITGEAYNIIIKNKLL